MKVKTILIITFFAFIYGQPEDCSNGRYINEIFNVGVQKSVNINEIARLLGGKKIYIKKRLGETRYSSSNIRKIKKQLKWNPKVSIKKGITLLIKKYK